MYMSENENGGIHDFTLANLCKCVCASPKDMNIFAVILANSLACDLQKHEILTLVHFFSLLCTALRSYL